MLELTKDIALGEQRYQLGSLNSRNGSYVAGQFLSSLLTIQLENRGSVSDEDLALILSMVVPQLPENIFMDIQGKCLAVCKKYIRVGDADVASPVLRQDGSWNAAPAPSIPEVLALTVSCLVFNLKSFFEPGASKMMLAILPKVNREGAPSSTATSSGPLPPGSGDTPK